GVQVLWPVRVPHAAPAGSAGLTDHVTGPVAHVPSVALGVTVSVDCSCTVCGSTIAATVTVPFLCVTVMLNVPVPAVPVAGVAVSVKGPYEPAWPQLGVQLTAPVEVLKLAPEGSAGEMDQVTGPVAVPHSDDEGVTEIALSSCVEGGEDTVTTAAPSSLTIDAVATVVTPNGMALVLPAVSVEVSVTLNVSLLSHLVSPFTFTVNEAVVLPAGIDTDAVLAW